jgi:hypothetical protein
LHISKSSSALAALFLSITTAFTVGQQLKLGVSSEIWQSHETVATSEPIAGRPETAVTEYLFQYAPWTGVARKSAATTQANNVAASPAERKIDYADLTTDFAMNFANRRMSISMPDRSEADGRRHSLQPQTPSTDSYPFHSVDSLQPCVVSKLQQSAV